MLRITPLPAFSDNYIWMLENAGETWVVDPGYSEPVLDYLDKKKLSLDGILITHNHPDHVSGVERLLSQNLRVIGSGRNRHPHTSEPVLGGEQIELAGLSFTAIAVPGHTMNHIAFYATPNESKPILFSGDTLFAAGCGRLFEGTPEMLHRSLSSLMTLPDETLIYCGHEYTLANLKFAAEVDPENQAVQQAMVKAQNLRAENQPTLPTILKNEKQTNPFLRAHLPQLRDRMKELSGESIDSDVECFAQLRRWKDKF
jgi:hydroxyacylglutathione hydrolase